MLIHTYKISNLKKMSYKNICHFISCALYKIKRITSNNNRHKSILSSPFKKIKIIQKYSFLFFFAVVFASVFATAFFILNLNPIFYKNSIFVPHAILWTLIRLLTPQFLCTYAFLIIPLHDLIFLY